MDRLDLPILNRISRMFSPELDKPYWVAVGLSVITLLFWVVMPEVLPPWLGILLVGVAWPIAVVWPRSVVSQPELIAHKDSDRELWHLVVEIDQLIAPEIVELRELITQGSHLIDNTTKELQVCFAELTHSTHTQYEQVTQIVQRLSPTSDSVRASDLAELDEIAGRVHAHINAAVRLLQFEDITQQVLGRVCLRIDFMERFVAELRQLPLVEPGHSAAQIEQARQRLQTLRAELRAAVYRPVSQTSMNEGEIELF